MSKPKGYKVLKQFKSDGLHCVIAKMEIGHLCGYVGVPKNHPLFGVEYNKKTPHLKPLPPDAKIGKRGAMVIFARAIGGEKPGNGETPEMYFDIHGSITFSSSKKSQGYPTNRKNTWWFGFDCAHAGDTPKWCDLEYVEKECRCLAKQLYDVYPEN